MHIVTRDCRLQFIGRVSRDIKEPNSHFEVTLILKESEVDFSFRGFNYNDTTFRVLKLEEYRPCT